MESKNWAEKEFELVDLGDDRLNQRLKKIGQQILESPQSHINRLVEIGAIPKQHTVFFKMKM